MRDAAAAASPAVRWRWARGVRAHFVLILLLAVILPNSLLAIWIGRSARVSALALLEQELHQRLAETATTIGYRWVELRSPLLTLAENPNLLAALSSSHLTSTAAPIDVGDFWETAGGFVRRVSILDAEGRVRVLLTDPAPRREDGIGRQAIIPVRIPIFDGDGEPDGTLEAGVFLPALLPPSYGGGAPAGAVPAVFTQDGAPIVPVAMEPLLRGERRFSWDDKEWAAAQRDVYDPPLRLALAAPTALHTAPFTAAARRGVLALVIVMTGSVLLILLLSRGVSVPIARLTGAAEEVARGRLDVSVTASTGPDEIRRLGRAFDSMTASLRRLIRRVSQQESAAAVGEFAATLAHEVRNPLTSVRLDLERAREHIHEAQTADDLLARALRQVERLDATVSGALRIARSGSLELVPLDLREPAGAAHRTASTLFAERSVHLAPWMPAAEPLFVRGNDAAIEQMLLNLLLNAADAVEDSGRSGSVSMEAELRGDDVLVRVRDTGRGMSEGELARAREPFYTTRAEGTGLGLAVVERIAHAHDAELDIQSREGGGTTVTVVFSERSARLAGPTTTQIPISSAERRR